MSASAAARTPPFAAHFVDGPIIAFDPFLLAVAFTIFLMLSGGSAG
jgi:hypothetical protein